MDLKLTRYGGRGDLARFLAFASATTAARSPLRATWHPGDLVWQLRGAYDRRPALYGFGEGAAFAAVAWFQGPGELLLEALPGQDPLTRAVLDWAVEKAAQAPSAMQAPELRVTAFDGDRERQETLALSGFERAGPAGVHFELGLAAELPEIAVPPGVRLRDCVGIDPDARSAVHRDAWSALGHLGIEGGASNFSTVLYQSLVGVAAYEPALDIVAEAEGGRLVANCIAWRDPASGIATFEPVGVHPDYRGRRLAGAVMLEALRRLKAAGARIARVGTAHFNEPAIASYRRAFALVDRSSTWSRPSGGGAV